MYGKFLMTAMMLGYGWPLWGVAKGSLEAWACGDHARLLRRMLLNIGLLLLFVLVWWFGGEFLRRRLNLGFNWSFWANCGFAATTFVAFVALDILAERLVFRRVTWRRSSLAIIWWMVFALGSVLSVYPLPFQFISGIQEVSGDFSQSVTYAAYSSLPKQSDAEYTLVSKEWADLKWRWLHHYEGTWNGQRLIISSDPCGGLYIHYGSEARKLNVCTLLYHWGPAVFRMESTEGEILISVGTEYFIYNIEANSLRLARPYSE